MKRILLSFLTLVLFTSLINVAYASNEDIFVNDYTIVVNNDSKGIIKNNILSYNGDNKCKISFAINGEKSTLEGNLYPFMEGLYKGKLIVGEFSNKKYRVDNFEIELKNKPEITYDIVDLKSNEKYRISSYLSEKDFINLYESQAKIYEELYKKNDYRDKYIDKIIKLHLNEKPTQSSAQFNNEVLNNDTLDNQLTARNHITSSRSQLPSFSYYKYKRFFEKLKDSDYAGVDIESLGIPESFLTSNGWGHYNDTSSECKFAISKYTFDNGADVYYTRLTMLDIIQGKKYGANQLFLQLGIKYGVMIEYAKGSNRAKLYVDDHGLKLKNVELAITKLRNNQNAIFTDRTVSGEVNNLSFDARGLIALIPYGEYLSTIWSAFTLEKTNIFESGIRSFGNTISEQEARYGKIVRGIAMDSRSTYIYHEDNFMRIEGTYNYYSNLKYNWAYKYWAYTF